MINRPERAWVDHVKHVVSDTERHTLHLIESGEFATDSKSYRTIYDINQRSHDILSAIRTYYP